MPSSEARASASSAVVYDILNGLAEGRLVPGQRLVEVDLAQQHGVSRNSVREALQQLASQGVVELSRHKGAAIRALSLAQTLEVLDVAERMTGLLARSAAAAIAAGQDAAPLRSALAELERADAAQDAEGFARARRGLYRALLHTSGSSELRRLFPSIQMPIVYAQHRPAALQQVRMRNYVVMIEAILRGDAQAADEAGMAHVRHVRAAVVQGLADRPEDQGGQRCGVGSMPVVARGDCA